MAECSGCRAKKAKIKALRNQLLEQEERQPNDWTIWAKVYKAIKQVKQDQQVRILAQQMNLQGVARKRRREEVASEADGSKKPAEEQVGPAKKARKQAAPSAKALVARAVTRQRSKLAKELYSVGKVEGMTWAEAMRQASLELQAQKLGADTAQTE